MSTCEGTRYLHPLLARAAPLGLASVALLGCFGDDPLLVGSNSAPSVTVPQTPLPPDVAFVRVHDARRCLALSAAKFFPAQPRKIAAVTGGG